MSEEVMTTIRFWVEVLSLVALVIYVIKTWQMASETKKSAEATQASVKEMQLTREREAAPSIVVYLDVVDNFDFALVIKNTGKTSASDLKINITPPLPSFGDPETFDINKLKFLTEGFATFPSGYEFKTTYTSSPVQLNSPHGGVVYQANVSYTDPGTGALYNHQFILDPSVFKGTLPNDDNYKLRREIKEITNQLKSINKFLRRS